jgi:hypothetical protein
MFLLNLSLLETAFIRWFKIYPRLILMEAVAEEERLIRALN